MAIPLENFKEGVPKELEAFWDVWRAPAEGSAYKFSLWIQKRGPGENLGVVVAVGGRHPHYLML